MARWTTQQVLDSAPDASSAAAARTLAKPGPWSETGATDDLVWGKCQGSGKTPYQVSIDLNRPAYKCSCPSRKFPCKHALALLLLWAESDGAVADRAEATGFAADWAAHTAAAQAARGTHGDKSPDPEAQARRRDQRLALMDAGLVDFSLWLQDLVRAGLAAARGRPSIWWDDAAARLVDAQLPGLADQVRQMASSVSGRPDWLDHLLAQIGRWWLVTRTWPQREVLDADTLGDLRTVLGWAVPTDEVRAVPPLQDTWQVLGAHRSDDGRLQQQRTWLRGDQTGELVLLLDFAAGGTPLPMARTVGATLRAGLHPYRGHAPRRVLMSEGAVPGEPRDTLPPGGTLTDALAALADQLTQNPWATRQPVVVDELRFTPSGVLDADDRTLPHATGVDPLPPLALTGGRPVRCFGEVEDGRFRGLSAVVEGRVRVL